MAKKESTQHKLDRVRAPRVQLTYDVEVGDAIEKKELPFVAGVVGNFSGQPAEPLGKLKDRKFVNVDKDNYDDVLKGMKPRVQMQVDNKLADDGSKLGVELNFRSLEDFSPGAWSTRSIRCASCWKRGRSWPTCATRPPATTSSRTCSTRCCRTPTRSRS